MAVTDGDDFQFKIPKDLPTDTMQQFQDIIESVDRDSLEESASYDFQNLIKKINKTSSSRRRGVGGSRVMAEQEPVAYHSAEYVVDSEDEDDAYFEGEQELRARKAIDFSDAEKRHREMVEYNERMKAQKLKEAAQAKRAALKGTSISLADHEDDKEDSGDDAGQSSASLHPPHRKASVNLDSDDDSDRSDDEITSRRPPPKSTSDVESEDDQPSQAAATPRRVTNNAAASSRRLVDLEDSDEDGDSENENEQQATQPLPKPSRTPTQTNKRRIILEDSEDEDSEENTQGSPAKKKHAFEE